jgi:hypothetical protein
MKTRRWKWIAIVVVSSIVIGVPLLARPSDEFVDLRVKLHATVATVPGQGLVFTFPEQTTEKQVLAALHSSGGLTACSAGCWEGLSLSGGRTAGLEFGNLGSYCILTIAEDKRPWYRQAWSSIKWRLGIGSN